MMVLVVAAVAVLVAAIQVAAVPLFTVAGATAELGVVAILVTLLVAGPRPAMLMTPAIALAVGFAGSRAPGLLLIGYTAVLPIGYLLDRYGMPPGPYPRLLITACAGGLWVRLVLSLSAFLNGAAFEPVVLLRDIITPGLAFDAALITLAYVPLRLAGHAQL